MSLSHVHSASQASFLYAGVVKSAGSNSSTGSSQRLWGLNVFPLTWMFLAPIAASMEAMAFTDSACEKFLLTCGWRSLEQMAMRPLMIVGQRSELGGWFSIVSMKPVTVRYWLTYIRIEPLKSVSSPPSVSISASSMVCASCSQTFGLIFGMSLFVALAMATRTLAWSMNLPTLGNSTVAVSSSIWYVGSLPVTLISRRIRTPRTCEMRSHSTALAVAGSGTG